MPICPNCGSYVSKGSHICSCTTSFSYNSGSKKYEKDYGEEMKNPQSQ